MKKISKVIIFFLIFILEAHADNKKKIINKLKNTSNLSFEFEQNMKGKIEYGNCIIEYPKKIYCLYKKNKKILVSNGKSLVIKTQSSYYRYPLKRTPLNLILDKNFLIDNIYDINEKIIDQKHVVYSINKEENKISLFFNTDTFNLIRWQTKDIYQNITVTNLYSILENQEINKKLFKLPSQN